MAERLAREARELVERHAPDTEARAWPPINLALALSQLGELDEARECLRESLEVFLRYKHVQGQIFCVTMAGVIERAAGRAQGRTLLAAARTEAARVGLAALPAVLARLADDSDEPGEPETIPFDEALALVEQLR